MSRRSALRKAAGITAVAAATPLMTRLARAESPAPAPLKGNIRHSVCRWCYGKTKLEDLCAAGKEMGLSAIDLLNPEDFPTLKQHGLVCAMVNNPTLDGLGGIPRRSTASSITTNLCRLTRSGCGNRGRRPRTSDLFFGKPRRPRR